MVIEHKPFYRTKTDEEREAENSRTFTIRINEKEEAKLKRLCRILDVKSESKAIKQGAWIGLNVLLRTFGEGFAKYLFKKERVRLSDYEDIFPKK